MNFPDSLALNRWRHCKRVPFIGVAPEWRTWLLDRGSLTDRLIRATAGDFRVQILRQDWQRPQLSEAKRLGIKAGQIALVREVLLVCHGQPWVYARSLFPLPTLTGPLRHLRGLDNRSLGSLLFRDPSMKRTMFEVAALESHRIKALNHLVPREVLWGRRSLFYIKNKPLLVAEVFLPALKARQKQLGL